MSNVWESLSCLGLGVLCLVRCILLAQPARAAQAPANPYADSIQKVEALEKEHG